MSAKLVQTYTASLFVPAPSQPTLPNQREIPVKLGGQKASTDRVDTTTSTHHDMPGLSLDGGGGRYRPDLSRVSLTVLLMPASSLMIWLYLFEATGRTPSTNSLSISRHRITTSLSNRRSRPCRKTVQTLGDQETY